MRKVVGAFIVMALVIAAVLLARRQTGAERPEHMAEMMSTQLAKAPKGSLTPEAVLAIAPRTAPNAAPASASPLAPSLREYYGSTNYASLYQRLSKGPRTPEEHWILAKILEYCAMIPNEVPRGASNPGKDVVATARAKFAASLSPSDPDRDKRLAAFDNSMRNPCQDLPRLQSTREEVDDLYRQGAAAGDAKARVALVLQDLRVQRQDRTAVPNGSPNFPKIGDEQISVIKQALASSDPTTAMEGASAFFFGGPANVSLREPDGKAIDPLALKGAATLIACDSGYPCGADMRDIANTCAFAGRCGATDLRDYLFYYRSSPYDSQMLARYETALRNAARTGDTSFFVFYPGPPPGIAAFFQ